MQPVFPVCVTVNTGLSKICHYSLQLCNEVLMEEEEERREMPQQALGDAEGRRDWFYRRLSMQSRRILLLAGSIFPSAFLCHGCRQARNLTPDSINGLL